MPVPAVQIVDEEIRHALRAAGDNPPVPPLRTVYLGREARSTRKVPRLTKYALPAEVQLPATFDLRDKARIVVDQMYANDQQGCCVVSSGFKAVGVWSGNDAEGSPIVGTDQQVLREYHRIGGPGDNGLVIAEALTDLMVRGWDIGNARRKIDGFGDLDTTDIKACKVIAMLFGGFNIGFNVPAQWMGSNTYEGAVWDTPTNWSMVGGHDMLMVGWNETGFRFATWGIEVVMTYAAFRNLRIVDEAYGKLGPDWYGRDGRAPNGLDVDSLKHDMDLFKSGITPPLPEPVPAGLTLRVAPTSGVAPLLAVFEGVNIDPNEPPANLDFGDGSPPATNSGLAVSHTYTDPGLYTATLTQGDKSATASVSVSLTPPPPPPAPYLPPIYDIVLNSMSLDRDGLGRFVGTASGYATPRAASESPADPLAYLREQAAAAGLTPEQWAAVIQLVLQIVMIFTKQTPAATKELTPAQWALIIKLVMELIAILTKKSADSTIGSPVLDI